MFCLTLGGGFKDKDSTEKLMAPFLSRVPKPMRALYDPELPIELRMAPFITPWDETQRPPRRAIVEKLTDKPGAC